MAGRACPITAAPSGRSWSRSCSSSGARATGHWGGHPRSHRARVSLWVRSPHIPLCPGSETRRHGPQLSASRAPSRAPDLPRTALRPQGGGWHHQQHREITEQSAPEPGRAAGAVSPGGRDAKGGGRRAIRVSSARAATCSPQQNSSSSLQRPVAPRERDEGSAVPDKPVLSV